MPTRAVTNQRYRTNSPRMTRELLEIPLNLKVGDAVEIMANGLWQLARVETVFEGWGIRYRYSESLRTGCCRSDWARMRLVCSEPGGGGSGVFVTSVPPW